MSVKELIERELSKLDTKEEKSTASLGSSSRKSSKPVKRQPRRSPQRASTGRKRGASKTMKAARSRSGMKRGGGY
jgi:hypothetical protein